MDAHFKRINATTIQIESPGDLTICKRAYVKEVIACLEAHRESPDFTRATAEKLRIYKKALGILDGESLCKAKM